MFSFSYAATGFHWICLLCFQSFSSLLVTSFLKKLKDSK